MIRTLAKEEFPRLQAIEEGFVPDPETSIAVVAEENGEITGRMLLMQLTHIEGTWVREDKRKTRLPFLLMRRTWEEARKVGCKYVMAYTEESNAQLADYMKRLGFEQTPVLVWHKELVN